MASGTPSRNPHPRSIAAEAFLAMSRSLPPPPPAPPNAPRIAVWLAPWYATAVPYFSAVLGMAMANRATHHIAFMICDIAYPPALAGELDYVDEILMHCSALTRFGAVERLSETVQPPSSWVDMLARQSTRYDWLHRIGFGATQLSENDYTRHALPVSRQVLAAVDAWMTVNDFSGILLPGGVVNATYGIRKLAEERGIRVATYDSGAGTPRNYVCGNGVAAQGWEIVAAVEDILARNDADELAFCKQKAEAYARQVADGTDEIFKYSFNTHYDAGVFDAVFLMSMEQDSGVLSLETIWPLQKDWIEQSVAALLSRSPAARIAIRQHPDERRAGSALSDYAVQCVRERFGQSDAIRIFDKHDDTPTQQVIRNAHVVLTSGSTAGLDAALLGKPVLSQASCYYARASFCAAPSSPEAFLACLHDWVSAKAGLSEEQRTEAAIYLYVRSFCWRVETAPTPDTPVFLEWIGNPEAFSALSREFDAMIDAILTGANFCIDKHRRYYADQGAGGGRPLGP